MISDGRVRSRAVVLVALMLIGGLLSGCGSSSDGSHSSRNGDRFEQPFTAVPPEHAPFPASNRSDRSLTYATSAVPEGWGIVGVTESTDEVALPSGVRTDRVRTVFYGPDRGRRIGFTITSMVQFSSTGEVIDARFDAVDSSNYVAQWQGDGVVLSVDRYDDSIDTSVVQENVYEMSEDAYRSLAVDVGRPRVIVGTPSGTIDDRRWAADASIPIEVVTSRGPGVVGCMDLRSKDGDGSTRGSDDSVCVTRFGQSSSAMVMQLDGRSFIVGVLQSTAESFIVRNVDPERRATVEPFVVSSDLDPSLRWIVAPLDEKMSECLTIESADGSTIESGGSTSGSSIRVGIPHSIPYGSCEVMPPSPTELGPAVHWDAVRSGTISDLEADGLVVTFVGSPAMRDSSDRCGATYVADAEETATEVIVSVRPVSSVGSEGEGAESFGCQAIGARRMVEVELDAPLGTRTVRVGPYGEIREVVDGSGLADPSWLPEGFAVTVEDGSGGSSGNPAWQRMWTTATTDQWQQVCRPTDQYISITEIRGEPLPALMPWERELPSVIVNGRVVRVLAETSEERGSLRLDLVLGERYLRIDGASGCMGAPGPRLDELVRVLGSAIQ